MNSYNFSRFENQGPSNENRISINKGNEIFFSSIFCSDNKVLSYKYAVLFWDSAKKAIGVHFTNDDGERGRYALSHSSKGGGARISDKGFFTTNKIDTATYAGRYVWEKYVDSAVGSLYVFKLESK